MPFGFTLDELDGVLTDPKVRDAMAETARERGRPLKLILAPEPPIDPLGRPEQTAASLASYVAIGATGFSVRFEHHSLSHFCEQMAALQSVVRAAGWSG
jgi:hypothetical protein